MSSLYGPEQSLKLKTILSFLQFLNTGQQEEKLKIKPFYSQETPKHMTGLQFFPVTCITFCAGAMYL